MWWGRKHCPASWQNNLRLKKVGVGSFFSPFLRACSHTLASRLNRTPGSVGKTGPFGNPSVAGERTGDVDCLTWRGLGPNEVPIARLLRRAGIEGGSGGGGGWDGCDVGCRRYCHAGICTPNANPVYNGAGNNGVSGGIAVTAGEVGSLTSLD